MKILTIGNLAKKAHVNVETIRYYEVRGLMPEPPRSMMKELQSSYPIRFALLPLPIPSQTSLLFSEIDPRLTHLFNIAMFKI